MDDPRPHSITDIAVERVRVRVRGAVQGVGFRPFVWQTAHALGLTGWVLNDEYGVLLEVEGAHIPTFLDRLKHDAPPLSRLEGLDIQECPAQGSTDFTIRASAKTGTAATIIPADAATCPACLEDIFDPSIRRYGYAFTNCTHCGPRYTITSSLPYDRAQTSMAPFEMCPGCQTEYEDPGDRRFHAQPNACPDCGPRLSHSIETIVADLKAGKIVALKGLGGYHLAVDARNNAAVHRLRIRKGRDGKPFAVMVAGLASAHTLAHFDEAERKTLSDSCRPILIAQARADNGLAPGVSNGLPTIGLMLPYTPLHALLFHEAAGRPDGTDWMEDPQGLALVMTSANPAGEPLIIDDAEARTKLAHIADTIVTHDRAIVIRADDSVVRHVAGTPMLYRKARGLTPAPIKLPHAVPPTLALGGHLKGSICVTREDEAYLSQHLGDMDTPASYTFLQETIAHLTGILEVKPERVACDLHPDFLTTRCAEETGLPLVKVQHHHAHIAAVAAEYGLDAPVLGLALDGFGLAADGQSAWGGELLWVDGPQFEHLGGLMPLAQPGGDKAARAPWRMAASVLHHLGLGDRIAKRFPDQPGAELVTAMLDRRINCPPSSSAGRLFDAAAGLLGLVPEMSFEGQAAMALEGLVRSPKILPDCWTITPDGTLDLRVLLAALLECEPAMGADLFHGTLAAALADWLVRGLDQKGGEQRVALSGGCFQNKILTETLVAQLAERGISAYLPRKAPPNDGGLSLGQAWAAAKAIM